MFEYLKFIDNNFRTDIFGKYTICVGRKPLINIAQATARKCHQRRLTPWRKPNNAYDATLLEDPTRFNQVSLGFN